MFAERFASRIAPFFQQSHENQNEKRRKCDQENVLQSYYNDDNSDNVLEIKIDGKQDFQIRTWKFNY